MTDNILVKNSVNSPKDILYLTLSVNDVVRCHNLPIANRKSVGTHTLNCLFLADFLYKNNFIVGTKGEDLTQEEFQELKDVLQYHDVGETIVGDIPAHFSYLLSDIEYDIKDNIKRYFIKTTVNPYIISLARQIDLLEFIIDLQESGYNVKGDPETFTDRRIKMAYENAFCYLSKIIREEPKYIIDICKVLDEIL